jgi:hypothetical protein
MSKACTRTIVAAQPVTLWRTSLDRRVAAREWTRRRRAYRVSDSSALAEGTPLRLSASAIGEDVANLIQKRRSPCDRTPATTRMNRAE